MQFMFYMHTCVKESRLWQRVLYWEWGMRSMAVMFCAEGEKWWGIIVTSMVQPWDGEIHVPTWCPMPWPLSLLQQPVPMCLKVWAVSAREGAQGWLGSRLTTRSINSAPSRREQGLALGSRNQKSFSSGSGQPQVPRVTPAPIPPASSNRTFIPGCIQAVWRWAGSCFAHAGSSRSNDNWNIRRNKKH